MSKIIFEIAVGDLPGMQKVHEMLGKMLDNELPWEVKPTPVVPVAPAPQVVAPVETKIDASKVGFGIGVEIPAPQAAAPVVPAVPAPQAAAPVVPAVPAPQAAAPVVPAVPAPQASGVELDVKGISWDERIHSSAKSKNQDGSWKKKRGVNPTLIAQVEAEQQSGSTVSLPVAPPVTIPAPQVVGNQMELVNDFIEKVTAAIQLSDLDEDTLYAEMAKHGLRGLTDIIKRPDLIPLLHQTLIPEY